MASVFLSYAGTTPTKDRRSPPYWRKSGQWPNLCFETDMPYDRKAEPAKLK
jgi:hypothetical protein